MIPNFAHYSEKLKARGIETSSDFCRRLLEETGIAILPGSDFGLPSNELIARMAYVNFDGAKALKVAEADYSNRPLDEAFLKRCCEEAMEGIEVLLEWIQVSDT